MMRMRNVLIAVALCNTGLLVGCSAERDAQIYAERLNGVLESYQGQVNKKIAAEEKSYNALALTDAQAKQSNILQVLALERRERSQKLADKFIDEALATGSPQTPSLSELHRVLQDYGEVDFGQTRSFLEEEGDGTAKALAALENLELEAAKVESLSLSLLALASPKDALQQLREFAAFAEAVGQGVDKLFCEDWAQAIQRAKDETNALADKKGPLEEEQKKLQAELEQEEAKPAGQERDSRIAELETQLKGLTGRITPLTERTTTLDAAIKRLTVKRTRRACAATPAA
jgi:hypothetical protein